VTSCCVWLIAGCVAGTCPLCHCSTGKSVNLHCSVRVFCSLFCPYICEGELLWGIWKGCNGTCLTLVKVLKDSPCFYIVEDCLLYILSQHVFCWLKAYKFFVLCESQLGVNFHLECNVDRMVDAQSRVVQLLKIKVDKCLCWGLASLWWMVNMVATKNFWCRCLATYYFQRHVLVLCIYWKCSLVLVLV
jgi:hypothetical protein